jgi:uncharacterized protein DUF6283
MTAVRKQACAACPYRRDVPSGVWAADEYDKLIAYDEPTFGQPVAVFKCHATPEFYCHGWAVVHSNRGSAYDLLALRLASLRDGYVDIPSESTPLFASGTEAAEHGKRDIDNMSDAAIETAERLKERYPRLRKE